MEIELGDLDSIPARCFISPDQEDIFESSDCLGLGESEALSEEELLPLSGEQADDSTVVFMASPEVSTQVLRDESVTPQETYHTPPEEAAPRSSSSVEEAVFGDGVCRDGESAVDLGTDDDLGIPERTERAVQQLRGADQLFEMGKATGLKRGPSSDVLSGGNEGLTGSPAEGKNMLEVKLYVETRDGYSGMLKEKLKENLEKAVESMKVHGPMVLRGIRIHGGTSIQRKLNSTVKLDDAPTVGDLEVEEESENVPEPSSSTDTVKLDDAPTVGDLKVEESENVPEPVGIIDKGEADRLIGADSAQMALGAEVRTAADIPNFTFGGKDLPLCDKGKEVSESEEIGIRSGENLSAQANDDGEVQSSAVIDIQKDKDGLQHKQDGRDSLGSVTDVEVIGVSRKKHRREVRNVEDIEKFRYNREEGPCLQDKEKAIAGQEEIYVSGVSRSKVQSRDDHEGQIPMEIDCGVERSQNMGVKDNKSSKSSDPDENLRMLPACIHELAKGAPGGVKASSNPLNFKELAVFDVLGKLAEASGGRDDLEEGSIVDFAQKLGITFPCPSSQRDKGSNP